MGVLAWSPLGRGALTGKYQHSIPGDSRAADDELAAFVAPYLGEPHRGVVSAVVRAAQGLGHTPVEVALAWVRDRPGVTSAIVGARNVHQLKQALSVEDIPRDFSRSFVTRFLVEQAERSGWELDRVHIGADGVRHVVLRRRIVRQQWD